VSHCRSWAEGCARAGIPLRAASWVASEEAKAQRRAAIDAYQRGRCSTADYCVRLAQALGGLYDEREVARVHDAWLLEQYPGVEQLVEELGSDPRLVTACLSNTNASHWRRLRSDDQTAEYPACNRLQECFVSHELGLLKPEAEIYHRVREQLDVAAEQILFFDDSRNNVEAARRAGWLAEQIDYLGDTAAQMRSLLCKHRLDS
jgi:FMN phosphatase YigB (HAD superfamily)